ncbi:MAG: SpoIIE family protein phosphatase [Candidatus Entotheonellia bacterium]
MTPVLERHPEIQAVEWIPYVTPATRAPYEAAAEQDGMKGFRIVERDAQGKLVPAGARNNYYPVYFVEPLERNRAALGFDLGSDAVRRQALVQARDTGLPAATARIVLVQETGTSYGTLVFLPIFTPEPSPPHASDTAQARGKNLLGFVLGVIRISSMIDAALQDVHDPNVQIRLSDDSAEPAERFLFAKESSPPAGAPALDPFASVHWGMDFHVAGRRWSLQMFATPGYVQSQRTWERWGILAFFLTLSAAQAAFLYSDWRRTAQVERLAQQRTAELNASAARVRATMENVADGIVTFDRRGLIESFNPVAERIFGYKAADVAGQHLNLLLPAALQPPELLALGSGGDESWITRAGLLRSEVVGRRREGEAFPLEITVSAMVLGGERLFIGVLRDLTEPKRAARALQEAMAARERMNGELRAAHDIQMGLLPSNFRQIMDTIRVDVHATLQPAREVGGDFYDVFLLENGNLGFVVGDVSGKGVPASLHMAMTKTLVRAAARTGCVPPAEVMRAVNDELCRDNDACVFVTAFFGVLDVGTGEVSYVNAGHNPPVHLRADGRVESLTGPGVVLGLMGGATYLSQRVMLTPGDCLILYTDGVTEALNPCQEFFTEARLQAEAAGVLGKPAADVVTALVHRVQAFADGTPQTDDLIVLALRYLGPPGPVSAAEPDGD